MSTARLMQMGAAGEGNHPIPLEVEDVFSTYLYTGNGSTQTITNDIDLAGEGGLVWLKSRSNAFFNILFDTERGVTRNLYSDTTDQQGVMNNGLTAFNSDGFTLDDNTDLNGSGLDFASWTFRKAPKFFDVVTYTGTGSPQTIAHNLGSEVGTMFIKTTSATGWWATYHRSVGATKGLFLNTTDAAFTGSVYFDDTAPTSSVFTVGSNSNVNTSGETYVAYLFAHNDGDGGFGPDGDADIIKCGSFTVSGSASDDIDLGFEPQFIISKNASGGNWLISDVMRGAALTEYEFLKPNSSDAAFALTGGYLYPTSNGFHYETLGNPGSEIIYIAIRRGTKVPESGTEVFAVDTSTDAKPVQTSNFPVDLGFGRDRRSGQGNLFLDRLRGGANWLDSTSSAVESSTSDTSFISDFDSNTSWAFNLYGSATAEGKLLYAFRRAPNFFDVVAFTATGSAITLPHNLTVAPEMIILKDRSAEAIWPVWHKDLAANTFLSLSQTSAKSAPDSNGFNPVPDAQNFYLKGVYQETAGIAGDDFIAYLFASLDGVSKVGSYTGNGTSQTIDCGFTSGARFILIKRTDASGDWYVWDTERGIVTGNDPFLELNTTDAEVTSDDSVDPDATGFIVNQTATTNINVSSASYIFYAVA